MSMKRILTLAVMLASVAAAVPAEAQQYAARRNGDIVQLEDQKNQIVVSIITSVGMIAYEMKVKGQDVLRGPCVDRRIQGEAGGPPGHSAARSVGKPPRRAGVLRQRQALPVRHGARQRERRHSHSRLHDAHRSVAGRRGESRRQGGVGDGPSRCVQAARVDEAVAVRAHDGRDLSPAGRHARSADEGDEPRDRTDAGVARMAPVLSVDRLAA